MSDFLTLFDQRVREHPGRPAVRHDGDELSYAALDRRSRAVAAELVRHGARPGTLVAVSVDRSEQVIVAILAVLRSGAVCVPLDRSYPEARIAYMLADSGARIVLTDDPTVAPATGDSPTVVEIGSVADGEGRLDDPVAPADDDLAYVIYTSGSTGRPKGVACERGGLSRLVEWQVRTYPDAAVPTTQFISYSFDVAFQEILGTLCAGGTLVVVPTDVRQDMTALLELLARERIGRVFLPTAVLHPLADAARFSPARPVLRDVFVAGEQLRLTPAIRSWLERLDGVRLHNQYGPTEAHVITVAHTLRGRPADLPVLPPIGTPLPHVDVRVVGDDGGEVDGVGELWLGGSCLARGYLDRPELTAERFPERDGRRWYRTGDLVSWRDGELWYHGRADRQVKIRGFRVEPGEIEAVLAEHPDVAEVAVVGREDATGNVRLVAYVARRGERGDAPGRTSAEVIAGWRAHLAGQLPAYLVPSVWQVVEQLPTLPNGKVDRAALPPVRATRPVLSAPFAAPDTDTERRSAELLAELFGLDEVGLDDNFFELGATSLMLAGAALRLRQAFGVPLRLVEIFETANVRRLAAYVDGLTAGATGSTEPAPVPGASARPGPVADADRSVAIVGMACRFPGAGSPDELWERLMAGAESVTRVEPPADADPDFVPAAAQLPDIERFDARFFGFSDRDARLLDPQHRIFLECAWEALEDAGLAETGAGRVVGVFGGVAPSTYLINNLNPTEGFRPDRNFLDASDDLRLLISTDKDFLTSLVSYKLDLRGPSLNVNAACATSLVAVHLACRSLLDGEVDVALAGAATVPVPQIGGYQPEPGMPFAPDGHCRPYDAEAAGTVFGSGVGAVVLKRLADALADGDDIHAVIRGTGVSNDGAGKVGISAPSVSGQARAVAAAFRSAGVTPDTISFVEGHGTATPVGDPIEVTALRQVYGPLPAGTVALGSVKSNLGHLGWAAGMAGLIKAVLALRHGVLPATLHFTRPNPELLLDRSPFFVNSGAYPLPADRAPHRAGVSAFGLGGANAHLVLEAAPARTSDPVAPASDQAPASDPAADWHVVPLSGRSPQALAELAGRHHRHLLAHPELAVADVARTLGVGRRHHEIRRGLVVSGRDDLLRQLHLLATGDDGLPEPAARTATGRVVGLFTGHGGEYHGMGRQLDAVSPVFRARVDSFDEQVRAAVGRTARELLYDEELAGRQITDVVQAHLLTFIVQLATADLWESLGLRIDIALGHSLGEFAAATVAGVLTPADGLALVLERGRLMTRPTPEGGMAVVRASMGEVRRLLGAYDSTLDVAAENTPANTVVSGPATELDRVVARLTADGVDCRRLAVLRAGHSSLMEPIADQFEAAAARLRLTPPRIDLISNLTGQRVTDEVCKPSYWREHLRHTVRFRSGVEAAAALGGTCFVEIGGHPMLLGMAQEVLPELPGPWITSMRRNTDDAQNVANGLAALYESGRRLDWRAVHGRGALVHLPTYPFQRRRHWVDAPTVTTPRAEPRSDELAYTVDWEPVEPAVGEAGAGRWLIVRDRDGIADGVADQLDADGADCVRFRVGDDGPAALADLLAARPDAAVALFPDPGVPGADAHLTDSLRPALETLVTVARQRAGRVGAAPVWIVTRGAQGVREADVVDPWQSTAWGVARALAVEEPDLPVRRLDLPASGAVDARRVADLLRTPQRETEIALRGGRAYAPRLVPDRSVAPPPTVTTDGWYLVTGGLGGLGRWTAGQLVDLGARRLVLIGRNPPSAEATSELDRLRARGAEVVVLRADVSRRPDVERVLSCVEADGRPLRGVAHCAGELDDALLADLSWSHFERALGAKAGGAWHLHTAMVERGITPDFFVLYSSATSLLGNFGQVAYAAANAFLDGLAGHRRGRGLAATSVNWGVWGEVGALRAAPALLAQLRDRGTGSLTRATGRAGLRRVLGTSRAQLAILPVDWSVWPSRHNVAELPYLSRVVPARTTEAAPATSLRARLARADPRERHALLSRHLRGLLERLAGHGGQDDDSFAGLGVDSLSAVQIRNNLQRALRCTLPPRLLLAHPTPAGLVGHLVDEVLTGDWLAEARSEAESAASAAGPSADAGPSEAVAGAAGPSGDAAAALPVGPLTVQQRRWLRLTREVGYGQRVVPVVVHSELDRPALRTALETVVGRHDLLRYRYPDGRVEVLSVDTVLPDDDALFVDLTGLDDAGRTAAVARCVEQCRDGMPDPTLAPSWTIRCLALAPARFLLLIGAQHLEFDGSGLSVFIDELRQAYQAARQHRTAQLPPVHQYAEYAEHQARYLAGDVAVDRAYFQGLFAHLPSTTLLPGATTLGTTRAADSARFTPDRPLVSYAELSGVAEARAVSPFALILASYAQVVSTMAGRSSVVLGVIRSGRSDVRFARTIGPFTAPFPVPVHVAGVGPAELVAQCDRLVQAITSRADYPPTDLLDTVPAFAGLPFDTYFTETCVNFLNYRHSDERHIEPRVEVPEILGRVDHPDLVGGDFGRLRRIPAFHLVADLKGDDLVANYWFHTERFRVAEVARWADVHREALARLLEGVR